ncbi:DUF2510 domain-containing protein [Rhodococcus sp. 06-156-3C]|nr:DUF2510 domain-containing protein [Rhodococcus sp. 06-156-4a]OZD15779.1 DUF2510 domain-containing protein [Rhodococcus sp. 06-156-3C]OZD21163.1 DUF2510 domain-containing protein [Rhodococcus sp. 06-156-4C]OZD32345.1 DUF2510 domain-containing protein [Rhodococcus sp. 06-156-3]OZD36567.1 DUF2510 domain-containing protein [Rhodococcus sp. 06-156-3b]OZF59287.1 DUF2510 domain-containing protein [Rhodococcus sp. 06-156-4]
MQLRWWDGQRWTGHVVPTNEPRSQSREQTPPSKTPPEGQTPAPTNFQHLWNNPDEQLAAGESQSTPSRTPGAVHSPQTGQEPTKKQHGRRFTTPWVVAGATLAGVLVLGVVAFAVVRSDNGGETDTTALPKSLACRVLPASDPINAGVNAPRPPESVRASIGSAELIAENRLNIEVNFSERLPPPLETVGTARSNYLRGISYGFAISFDDEDSRIIALDGDVNEGWTLTEFHDDETTTVDTLPNVTVGPNSVWFILELEKFSSIPTKLDPTIEVSSALFPGPTQDLVFYPYQRCE